MSAHSLPADAERKQQPVHTRRGFLGGLVGAAAAATLGGTASPTGAETTADHRASAEPGAPERELSPRKRRAQQALKIRVDAAEWQAGLPFPEHPTNGDERRYANKIATFTKGLPHNRLGEVELAAYESLRRALETGRPADFDRIVMGGTRELVNPQAGLAFVMAGPDSHHLGLAPPPAFDSAEEAGEIAENYWMALARDVPFSKYEEDPIVADAVADLSSFTDFKGPRIDGRVTPRSVFRGRLPGTLTGPFISQFLWLDTPFGAERVDRRMETALPGIDYMVSYGEWLAVQNGGVVGPIEVDETFRYVRSGRDLGEWVHRDPLFHPYLSALFILLDMGAPLDRGNPYNDLAVYDGEIIGRYSRNQLGFGTLGEPHFAALVTGVTKPALAAVWYQKWFVHRRLRPEVFGGRIHNHLTGVASYPIHPEILRSPVLERTFSRHGSYLLPQAYSEGSPTHPAYGAGHATIAGACVTVLKALFDESYVFEDPVETVSSGTGLSPYEGEDLTVGGELNKLAADIAIGRNFAGIHWRTDFTESVKLGEEVAIRFLTDEFRGLNEDLGPLTLTKFGGTTISI